MNDLRMSIGRVALLAAPAPFALLCGCVMMPTAPMVPAMAGSQKTMEQFASDDANCRGYAQAGLNGPSQAAANNVAANMANIRANRPIRAHALALTAGVVPAEVFSFALFVVAVCSYAVFRQNFSAFPR